MKATPIRCLLIDDEVEAHYIMKELLREIPVALVVGEAPGAEAGLKAIQALQPDLIFLDIQMPGKSGLDLCQEIETLQLKTKVVFVTAYDSYTVQALRLAALDYLMKPVDPQELKAVFDRFQAQQHQPDKQQNQIAQMLKQMVQKNKIRLNTRTGYILVDPAEIIHIEADGNYSK
ncbi:MAG: LytR/AlgR family response regulator transcription factor, partial [Bacteroidales bacterium]